MEKTRPSKFCPFRATFLSVTYGRAMSQYVTVSPAKTIRKMRRIGLFQDGFPAVAGFPTVAGFPAVAEFRAVAGPGLYLYAAAALFARSVSARNGVVADGSRPGV